MPVRSVQPPSLLQNESVSKARGDKSAQAVSLHPSWLAKQKQKEALATTDSAGSKTVVSDDGQPVAPRRASAASTDTSGAPPVRHKQQSEQKAMRILPGLPKRLQLPSKLSMQVAQLQLRSPLNTGLQRFS